MVVGPRGHHFLLARCPAPEGDKYVLVRAVTHSPCMVAGYAREGILKAGRVTLNNAQVRLLSTNNIFCDVIHRADRKNPPAVSFCSKPSANFASLLLLSSRSHDNWLWQGG